MKSSICYNEATSDGRLIAEVTAPKVNEFPSVAGSISITSSTYLWLLARYFSPRYVLEIGTYIGRSTLAILFGGVNSVEKLYTCDGTFDCLNFLDYKKGPFQPEKVQAIEKVDYFGKTMSTALLNKMRDDGVRLDLIFIDGRVSNEDCQILPHVMSDKCVIFLDDFEGVEKGVVNAMMLRSSLKGMILLNPAVEENYDVGNLALLVPANMLTLSRQQSLPVDM